MRKQVSESAFTTTGEVGKFILADSSLPRVEFVMFYASLASLNAVKGTASKAWRDGSGIREAAFGRSLNVLSRWRNPGRLCWQATY